MKHAVIHLSHHALDFERWLVVVECASSREGMTTMEVMLQRPRTLFITHQSRMSAGYASNAESSGCEIHIWAVDRCGIDWCRFQFHDCTFGLVARRLPVGVMQRDTAMFFLGSRTVQMY